MIRKTVQWTVLLLSAGVALLLIVCGVNTLRFKSRQIDPPQAEAIQLNRVLLAQQLSRAIQLQTLSFEDPQEFDPQPFLDLHDLLAQEFPLVHERLTLDAAPGFSRLYRWDGADADLKPILLLAHLDVVPVDPKTAAQWTHPPFSGFVDERFVWGRGALDVKDGVIGILAAVEYLLSQDFQPQRTIYVALGHDEELGGAEGNAKLAELLRSRGALEFVLDEGGAILQDIVPGVAQPVAFVGVAEKGHVTFELTVRPQAGGHSSMPPDQTAIGILCAAIARLEAEPMPLRLSGPSGLMLDYVGPHMPFEKKVAVANRWLFGPLIERQLAAEPSGAAVLRTTTAATMIEGGVKENVLPQRASAVINFRILPGDTIADVQAHIERVVADDRVQVAERVSDAAGRGGWNPSAVSDVNSDSFLDLQRAIGAVYPDAIVAPGLVTGATDARHYEGVAANIYRFTPARLAPADLPRIHGLNERIAIDDLVNIVRFYIELMRLTCGE